MSENDIPDNADEAVTTAAITLAASPQKGGGEEASTPQEEVFLQPADPEKRPLTRENAERRHLCTGPGPVAPLPPLGGVSGSSGWSSEVITDTFLSRCRAPQFEVLTKTIRRSQKPAVGGPSFGEYESMRAMCENSGSVVVALDTEFTSRPSLEGMPGVQSRTIDSYQFAVIHPTDPAALRLVTILPLDDRPDVALPNVRITLERALEVVIEFAGLHYHPLAPEGWTEKGVARSRGFNADGEWRSSQLFRSNKREGVASRALPVTLVGHYMHADLTTFADHRMVSEVRGKKPSGRAGVKARRGLWLDREVPDILRTVISASGGMVSVEPIRLVLRGGTRDYCRPVELSIRDSLGHAPAEGGALEVLGKAVGHPKIDVPGDWKTRMSEYRQLHRNQFLKYGAEDSIIVLEYVSALYGDNRAIPLTLPTAAARAIREAIKKEECMTSNRAFDLVFAGLIRSDETSENDVGVEDQLDYYRKNGKVPVDGAAATWQHACANAFRGGYNACNEIGFFPQQTNDFDLISCYPTSESILYDVDFTDLDGVILETVNNVPVTPNMIPDPLTPFVGFVRFRFPDHVTFPTIPVPVDSSMVFPRSSGAGRGVWASGPEIWLALQLGAEVFCQIGHLGRVRRDESGEPSRMLRGANRQLVEDRERAKRQFGKKSLEQGTIKIGSNSGFGKLCQGVMGQKGWDAWAQERDAIGGSSITSPYHGMMTTGIVRAVLLATMNQLSDLGYSTPSNTTDGLITDAGFDVIDGLDLYGLTDIWREARHTLTGSSEMWERKHHQTDLLNWTTRGNVSRQPHGVNAHAGYKLPRDIVEDSQEDRDLMYRLIAGRDGAVPCTFTQFPSVQELTRIELRHDFAPKRVEKAMLMEYDRKRRPVEDGLRADLVDVDVDDETFEVAHVRTVPWDTPEQAVLGRSVDSGLKRWDPDLGEEVWARSPVRRTEAQWQDYLERLDALLDEDGAHSESARLDRIAKSIVIAQRQGIIDVPWLRSEPGNGEIAWRLEKLTWFGLPLVKPRFWHHAKSDVERQIEVALDEIAPYVEEMQVAETIARLGPDDWFGGPDDDDFDPALAMELEAWAPPPA